jgi:hypothetical protein
VQSRRGAPAPDRRTGPGRRGSLPDRRDARQLGDGPTASNRVSPPQAEYSNRHSNAAGGEQRSVAASASNRDCPAQCPSGSAVAVPPDPGGGRSNSGQVAASAAGRSMGVGGPAPTSVCDRTSGSTSTASAPRRVRRVP